MEVSQGVKLQSKCHHSRKPGKADDCFHRLCYVVGVFQTTDRVLIQNPAGCVRGADPDELEVLDDGEAAEGEYSETG
jgi:hypothetical protein